MAEVERKFVLTKLGPGDYLLPSNDGKILWRLSTYEDGPSHGLDPEVFSVDFTRWALKRWDEPVTPGSVVNVEDPDRWPTIGSGFETRREAMDAALADGGKEADRG